MPFSFNRVGWVWIVSLLCLLWAGAGETAHLDPVSTAAPPELGPITANGQSFLNALSRDGRWTAWHSLATDVLADQSDSNNGHDVFLRDRLSGENILVSHVPGDTDQTGNGGSSFMSLSADGAWGAFVSEATNLTTDNYVSPAAHSNILLYDRATGAVSLATHSAANPTNEAFGASSLPSISADGNFVAFHSMAQNLVSGQVDVNGGNYDVFLYDRVAGTTTLVSRTASSAVTTSSVASNQPMPIPISADGRYVAFTSEATDLVTGQVDTPGTRDVFLFDRVTGTTTLVSHAAGSATTAGDDACPDTEPVVMSADGRWIAFVSQASDLVSGQVDPDGMPDVFLFDRVTGTTTLVSHAGGLPLTAANGISGWPSLSDDGQYLAYNSSSSNLGLADINNDYDVFLWYRITESTALVSHLAGSIAAADPNAFSYRGFVSGNGRNVLFHSYSTGLVEGQSDTNGTVDLFLFDRVSSDITLVSRASGTQTVAGNGNSGLSFPGISSDGSIVAFTSDASNLYVGEANATSDVFLFTLGEFYTAIPCRVLDTRESGPVLSSDVPRSVIVTGFCDIPTWARAVSLNVTVTQASGEGHLTLHPWTQEVPLLSSTINFSAGQTRANNALVLLSEDGRLTITPFVAGNGTVHAIVDVNGYFE